jgi:hypothetical protein
MTKTELTDTLAELEVTILTGWPHDAYPDDNEAQAIESTYHELSLHEPTLFEARRWYLAGQIVARIKRDHPAGMAR